MSTYRDGDPRLRIDTLEAKLAERDASLAARDAELAELRALVAGSPEGLSFASAPRLVPWLAMGAVLTSVTLGAAYAGLRLETARVRAVAAAQLARLSEERAALEVRSEDASEKLLACAHHADPPPPSQYFGSPPDRAAITRALDEAASGAGACGLPGGPTGTGRVKIIFDPLQGKPELVSIDGAPFAGSISEPCILAQFLGVRVGAFKSARATIIQSFTVR
jgi:hypothetical protein